MDTNAQPGAAPQPGATNPDPTPQPPVQATPPAGQTPPPGDAGNGSSHPNTGMAILSYLGILVLVPLLTDAKNDPFVKFHIKQGLVLLICFVIAMVLNIIPPIGILAWIACLILMIIGIMNAANHKQVELPVIGQFAKNFHF